MAHTVTLADRKKVELPFFRSVRSFLDRNFQSYHSHFFMENNVDGY